VVELLDLAVVDEQQDVPALEGVQGDLGLAPGVGGAAPALALAAASTPVTRVAGSRHGDRHRHRRRCDLGARVSAADLGLVVSVLFAAAVEFVEALTIVLAMGVTRGWRSAIAGTVAALAALAVVAALAGYALAEWLPEALLQLIVGTLLLIFGLQWLRKAILRSSGLVALNDEDEVYREELEAGRAAGAERRLGLDWFGFVVSFKGVFLEGLEIVFIVITFGLNADDVPAAAAGAAIAGVVVLGIGAAAHKPLANVPQNTIKFAVGLLLSTFGTFWAVEGLGVFAAGSESLEWPGGDAALLALLAIWAAFSWSAIRLLRPVDRTAAEGA
jgi:Ca2+/H+ antiporter, TMEM165/GDT1 family